MRASPRNRVVVFRLTQEEFRNLRLACDLRGARNISEFTRAEILDSLHPAETAAAIPGLERIHREIRQLQCTMVEVLRKLEERKRDDIAS